MPNQNKFFTSFSSHKKVVSGELFKEPLMDIFLTNLEQTAFSLNFSKQKADLELLSKVLPLDIKRSEELEGAPQKTPPVSFGEREIFLNGESDKRRLSGKEDTKQTVKSKVHIPVDTTTTFSPSDPFPSEMGLGKEESLKPLFDKANRLCRTKPNREIKELLSFGVKMANYVNCGERIGDVFGKPAVVSKSGKIIKISKKQIVLQKTQVLLFYSEANVHVKQGDWVKRGAPILTLTNNTLITGDIVQGIPRIEQLFEAPNAPPLALRTGEYVYTSLHSQIREIFRKNWLTAPLPVAVRNTLQEMQQILIESIQKVYLSQGVLIADKHVEIVVAQMTNKAQIVDSGSTGLFLEEVLSLREIENANIATPGRKALYVPTVIGLTKSALHSDSFLSAASFQETSRVLSRDAIIGKSDFLRGLKEKVVVGDIISAGTGLDTYFVYTLLCNKQFSHLLKYPDFMRLSLTSKNQNKLSIQKNR